MTCTMSIKNRSFLELAKKRFLTCFGFGKFDSPGYSAKYGTFKLMNSKFGEILDFNVIHVPQAKKFYKNGTRWSKIAANIFESRNVTVSSLTTDRHRQVGAFVEKEKPNINHQFDIWHVGKDINKVVVRAKKSK